MGIFSKKPTQAEGLVDFELWGAQGYTNQSVAGESNYMSAIRKAHKDAGGRAGDEVFCTVELAPEPTNRHDRNAVQVRAASGTLGYLPREDAARYSSVLTAMRDQGLRPVVPARIWVDPSSEYASVNIALAAPHMITPMNEPPVGNFAELPVGSAIQLTGEEKHLDTLRRWIRPQGEGWVWVTLHAVEVQSARSAKTLVEARLDGATVGTMSPKLSGDVLPALVYMAERGVGVSARAIVKGNALKVEVVVYAARAHELPDSFLSSLPTQVAVATPQQVTEAQPVAVAEAIAQTAVERVVDAPEVPPPPPVLPPAAWYADPHGVARLRWWDGQSWTDHVAD